MGIATIVVFGLSSGQADWGRLSQSATGYVAPNWSTLVSAMFTAMLAAFWAYEGWNTIGYIGGEIQNPNRNLPIVLFWGVMTVITVYVLANLTYLVLLPVDQLIEIKRATNSIAAVEAIKSFWGAGGGYFISVLILVTTLASTHTTILLAARTYFAMAAEGVFFKGADAIHPQYQTPSKALIYQCIWTCALVFTGSFDQLTDMLIFASFLFYGATTLGVFILRRKMPDAHRPYKVWGYPVVPIVFILFCIVLIGNTIINQPREALIGLTLIALGIPFYYWWTRRP
jgi:APA family basic amino acid/polyamine antiporter